MDVEGFEAGECVTEGGDDGSEGDVMLRGVGAGVEVDVGDDVETAGGGVGGKEEFHGERGWPQAKGKSECPSLQ